MMLLVLEFAIGFGSGRVREEVPGQKCQAQRDHGCLTTAEKPSEQYQHSDWLDEGVYDLMARLYKSLEEGERWEIRTSG